MKFRKTFWFVRRYVYLGRYVFEKLLRMGGGTFIWVGTFIWHWIVCESRVKRWFFVQNIFGIL